MWGVKVSILIIFIFIVVGILQLILGLKKKKTKIILLIIHIILSIVLAGILYIVSCFMYCPQYIVNKDNQKMVAEVRSFHHTYINYYKYVNSVVKGTKLIEDEYYGRTCRNPFKTDDNYIDMLEK